MLTSHDAVGAEEPLHEAGLNSIYNPNEIPGIFAKVHSLLSTPASITWPRLYFWGRMVDSLESAYANEFTN